MLGCGGRFGRTQAKEIQQPTRWTTVTIVRIGATKEYSDGWESAFSKGKKKAGSTAKAKKSKAKKSVRKSAKKRPAAKAKRK